MNKVGTIDIIKAYFGGRQLTSNNAYIGSYSLIRGGEPVTLSNFYVEANEPSTISFSRTDRNLQYSTDGTTWTNYTGQTISISTGQKCYWQRTVSTVLQYAQLGEFSFTGSVNVGGNIASLLVVDFEDFTDLSQWYGENDSRGSVFYKTFASQTALINAEDLIIPFEKVGAWSFRDCFSSCSNLITAPQLSATTIATGCFIGMFANCSSLKTVPELPATTLFDYCYQSMFIHCYALDIAPVLPATVLKTRCYKEMFRNTLINKIEIYADENTASECLTDWLTNVSSTGTFYNYGNATYSRGGSGIPTNWTEYKPANLRLTYTSTDGNIVTPFDTTAFNAEIESNTYEGGVGTIVFKNTLTTIGANAFKNCSTLNSVTFPQSLTSIGSYSFYNTNLTNVTIPNSVTSMGEACFAFIESLTGVTLSSNCTTIPNSAFNGDDLRSVNLPSNVRTIGSAAFKNNANLYSINLNNITSMGSGAFENTDLRNVTLNNSLTTLNGNVFKDCDSLTGITLGSGLTSINNTTFDGCTGLNNINYNNTRAAWANVSKSVTVWEDVPATVVHCTDGDALLSNQVIVYTSTAKVNPVEEGWGANIVSNTWSNGNGIIMFDDDVTSVPASAFTDNSVIQTISLPTTVTAIGERAFNGTNITEINGIENVSTLGASAFRHCKYVNNITLGSGVTMFDTYLMEDTPALTDITFKGTKAQFNAITKAINWHNYSNLETIHCADGNITIGDVTDEFYILADPTESGTVSFSNANCDLQVSTDRGDHWSNYNTVKNLTTQKGCKMWFRRNSSTKYTDKLGQFTIVGDVSVGGNANSLISNEFATLTSLAGWGGYEGIFKELFKNCSTIINANELVLPATTLNYYCYYDMFYYCDNLLTAPALPATTLSYYCYSEMFYHCDNLLTAPALPATTLSDGCYRLMFANCESLVNAPALPATTLTINCYESMFMACTSLVKAPELPATTLNSYCYNDMFLGCTSLNEITCYANDITAEGCLSDWVINVASTGTFYKLGSANFPTGVNGIPTNWEVKTNKNSVILYTSSDGNIVRPYTTAGWGANIVSNTYSGGQGKIEFDGIIDTIPNQAFNGDRGTFRFTSVVIPEGVVTISESAFNQCRTLTSVTLPSTVRSIGDNGFNHCESLTSINIPDGFTTFVRGCLAYTKLTYIDIPLSVTAMGEQMFWQTLNRNMYINFGGTIAQWNALPKNYGWNYYSYSPVHFLVHCTDGDTNA